MVYRVFLAGCKTLSVKMLESLILNPNYEVVGVLTKDHWEDMRVWHEMGQISLEFACDYYNVENYQWENINEHVNELTEMNLDFIFVASWPQIIKAPILELPKVGAFNIHIAALPHNRGVMPVHWAITLWHSSCSASRIRLSSALPKRLRPRVRTRGTPLDSPVGPLEARRLLSKNAEASVAVL